MSLPIVIDPMAVAGSAAVDMGAASELGGAAVGAAPSLAAIMPAGLDPTSLMLQGLILARSGMTLTTLAEFTGQRMFHGAAKDLIAGTWTAQEAINVTASMLGG
ncbi:hypothetical protein [Mycobacteroides abscessus]|uniref:hypothetical protein n=1 Tax=Mycobacteroides abscessus TaxID=36809 RepID=UPI0011C3ED2A|nr:hypothetical protein [Mycobacteroides abscessus]MDO3042040.1 hypothetical protein [Mycobacteroides abscessus subsp. abscessus]MDO3111473.1 hypothetical protein [Mycobacteroides abscessus subsp. massiliense]